MNRKAFVFTGMAFLLVVPAIILVASLTNMLKTGDVAVATAIRSDTVFYVYVSIKDDFEDFCEALVPVYGDKNETIRDILRDSWAPTMENDSVNRFGVNVTIDKDKIAVLKNQTGGANYILIGNSQNISWAIPINISDLTGDVLLTKGLGPLRIGYTEICPSSTQSEIDPIQYFTDECKGKNKKVNITVYVRNSAGDRVDADSVGIVANETSLTVDHLDLGEYRSVYPESGCVKKKSWINITATINKTGCVPSSFDINMTYQVP